MSQQTAEWMALFQRPRTARLGAWLVPFAAIAAALVVGVGLVAATSSDPLRAVSAFVDGAFGSSYAIAASLNRSTAFMLVSVGFLFAFRARLTNVGGEGQLAVGGVLATAFALEWGADTLPGGLAVAVPLAAAAVAGGLWGAIAGALKVWRGANEVITTLMLTFIGLWLLYWVTHSVSLLRQPMTDATSLPESATLPVSTHMPVMAMDSSGILHAGLVVALVLAAIVAVVLSRTVIGVWLEAVGLNPQASRRAGLPNGLIVVLGLSVAGALSGLAGGMMIQGDQHNLKAEFPSGYGFDGLVIGLLARQSVTLAVLFSLFFGFLRSGGIYMEIVAGVPSAVVHVMQGVVVLTVAGSAWFARRVEASA
ncbi:MAG: ABC transporter permease [Minwuia sp.]|uniref:ABC transporter permease n=1 Tax=Minwuia sp. TaxID=2493630 RepID=UPI003A848F3C